MSSKWSDWQSVFFGHKASLYEFNQWVFIWTLQLILEDPPLDIAKDLQAQAQLHIYIYISIFIYSCMYVIFFCSVKSLIVTTSSPMSHLMMGVDPRNSNGFQRQAWTPMLRNFAPTCGRASLLVMAAGCLVRWVCLKKFWRKTHKSKWFIITLLLNSKHLGVTICGIHFIYSSNFLIHWGWGPYCGLPQVYFGTEFWLWSASIFTNIQWN